VKNKRYIRNYIHNNEKVNEKLYKINFFLSRFPVEEEYRELRFLAFQNLFKIEKIF